MRISDWSSDVCSSDLGSGRGSVRGLQAGAVAAVLHQHVAGGVRLDDMRLGDAGQSIKHPGHAPHVLRLVAHVDLVAQECAQFVHEVERARSEEHTSELQSLMRISYAVFCLNKKNYKTVVEQYHNKSIS